MLDEIVENPNLNRRAVVKGLAALAGAALTGIPTYAAGDNSTTVEQTQNLETLVYKGITYRQLEENSKIYVPLGATPEEQAYHAFHPGVVKSTKSELNQTSFRNNPIDEVRYTITPTEYMERIKDTYKIAAKNNGKGYPEDMEEVYKIAEKHGWPVYLLGTMSDVEKVEGRILITPEKVEGEGGYSMGVILEKPSEETKIPYLTLRLPITPEGKVIEEAVTLMKEGKSMKYTDLTRRYIEKKGMIRLIKYGGHGIESYKIPEGMRTYTAFLPLAVEKIVEENGKRIAYITPIPGALTENIKTY